ncbi:MAG: hypothetical protein ABSH30_03055 [Acidimicrobiales bacterium]
MATPGACISASLRTCETAGLARLWKAMGIPEAGIAVRSGGR